MMEVINRVYHFFCADLNEVGAAGVPPGEIIQRMKERPESDREAVNSPYAKLIWRILYK